MGARSRFEVFRHDLDHVDAIPHNFTAALPKALTGGAHNTGRPAKIVGQLFQQVVEPLLGDRPPPPVSFDSRGGNANQAARSISETLPPSPWRRPCRPLRFAERGRFVLWTLPSPRQIHAARLKEAYDIMWTAGLRSPMTFHLW
jgi:hypothetical protein